MNSLEETLLAAISMDVAVFMHKPPFLHSHNDVRNSSMTVAHEGGNTLWRLVEKHGVKLVACGHRHEYRTMRVGRTTIVWAPTTSDLLDDRSPPYSSVPPSPGLVEYLFHRDGFHHAFIPFDRLAQGAERHLR